MEPVRQGDIFWVNLNPVKGHEQSDLRPALVLQNNIFSHHLNTVVVAPVTSNLALKGRLTTYFMPAKISGLKKDSLALIYQARAIDKKRLIQRAGHLPGEYFTELRIRLIRMFY